MRHRASWLTALLCSLLLAPACADDEGTDPTQEEPILIGSGGDAGGLSDADDTPSAPRADGGGTGGNTADTGQTGGAGDDAGGGNTAQQGEVGGACAADGDCAGPAGACFTDDSGFPGGYCVQEGCSESQPCPVGATCFRFQDDVTRCLADCTSDADCRSGYACDADNTCWPSDECTADSCAAGHVCNEQTGRCECTPGACGEGMVCNEQSGQCNVDLGAVPAGPIPDCSDTIGWQCDGSPTECATLEPFEPVQGDGWWNYPLNGETAQNQYRSYLRRDTAQLVKYAAAKVACKAGGWPGNGGLLGLGDMSEADGAIPGTSVGSPGHPQGTHVNGFDIDIAYYQVNTSDNRLRPVCDHEQGGQDVYHCTSDPYLLDVWRTALFLAHLHDAVIHQRFQTRVIGVDGKAGPLLMSAIDQLCAAGWYTGYACQQQAVTYETTDEGRGWYRFHHHHLHLSTNGLHPDVSPFGLITPVDEACLSPGCRIVEERRQLLDYGG